MTILELANALKAIYDQHGDVTVMFSGPNDDLSPYSVGRVNFQIAEEDEFDPDWNMPAGFKFVQLEN